MFTVFYPQKRNHKRQIFAIRIIFFGEKVILIIDQARCEDTAGQSYSIGLTILISRHQKSSVTVLPCVTGVLSRLAALTVKAADLILFAFRDSFASK